MNDYDDCATRDDEAVAYYTGAADARNRRPRRRTALARGLADAYRRGYESITQGSDQ